MKKLLILFAGLIILGTTACRKVTEEYYTTPNQTVYYNINSNDWSTTDNGITYSGLLTFDQNDVYFNDLDGLFVYISYDNGVTYNSIPQTYNGLSYSFSATNNDILIEVQSSTIDGPINKPGEVLVKVVMVPSEE